MVRLTKVAVDAGVPETAPAISLIRAMVLAESELAKAAASRLTCKSSPDALLASAAVTSTGLIWVKSPPLFKPSSTRTASLPFIMASEVSMPFPL